MNKEMTLIAKTVVDKRFWILQDGDKKIGNVTAEEGKYQVKIHNEVTEFKTIRMVESAIGVKFEPPAKQTKITTIRGYNAGAKAFNQTWDVEQGLPLFTKTAAGQCWYAAGWYLTKKNNEWVAEECPKLIYLQRYPFKGPYLTKGEAENGRNGI